MAVSVLLRLRSEPTVAGDLVGRVRVVETGEETVVRSGEELVTVLLGLIRRAPVPGGELGPSATPPENDL